MNKQKNVIIFLGLFGSFFGNLVPGTTDEETSLESGEQLLTGGIVEDGFRVGGDVLALGRVGCHFARDQEGYEVGGIFWVEMLDALAANLAEADLGGEAIFEIDGLAVDDDLGRVAFNVLWSGRSLRSCLFCLFHDDK